MASLVTSEGLDCREAAFVKARHSPAEPGAVASCSASPGPEIRAHRPRLRFRAEVQVFRSHRVTTSFPLARTDRSVSGRVGVPTSSSAVSAP
jgi:hypothetical protein